MDFDNGKQRLLVILVLYFRYKVSVTMRRDVPGFQPLLPNPAIFKPGLDFRYFLINKLINAQTASYEADTLKQLHVSLV